MPLFQVQDSNAPSAAQQNIAAQQAFSQMAAQAQRGELAERELMLSEQRAAQYAQNLEFNQGLAAQEFDWQKEYQQRTLQSRQNETWGRFLSDPDNQPALDYMRRQGSLESFSQMDLSEPGAHRLFMDAQNEARVDADRQQLDWIMRKGPEVGFDEEELAQMAQQGVPLEGVAQQIQTRLKETWERGGRAAQASKWVTSKRQEFDAMGSYMKPEEADEVEFWLSFLEQQGEDLDLEQMQEARGRLAELLSSPEYRQRMEAEIAAERAKTDALMQRLAESEATPLDFMGAIPGGKGLAEAAERARAKGGAEPKAPTPEVDPNTRTIGQLFSGPERRSSAAGNRGEPVVTRDESPEGYLKNPKVRLLADELYPLFEAANESGDPADKQALAEAMAKRGLRPDPVLKSILDHMHQESGRKKADALEKQQAIEKAFADIEAKRRSGAMTEDEANEAMRKLQRKHNLPPSGVGR